MTDFTIFAGEDWPQLFHYVDANGDGINISTASEILFVATTGSATTVPCTAPNCFTKTLNSGVELTEGGTTGEFTVTIGSGDTHDMGGKTFSYEIKLTMSSVARVIYPAPTGSATFNVLSSLTDGVT